jgi:hypothetical protein
MLVVVGGHTRNIGKTSVVAALIQKFKSRRWAAVKITQYGHGICSREGEPCGCASEPEHPFALTEEYESGDTDSGRFLAAGAERAFWLRAPSGQLRQAESLVRKILAQNENVVIESNSVVELFDPDLFLMVLDFSAQDFKPSSARVMERADAFLIVDHGGMVPLWEELVGALWQGKPQFPVEPPRYFTTAVAEFVRSRLSARTSV